MIRVEYGVTTTGAKEGFVPELLHCASISNADDLAKDDLIFKNFANPCERYSVLLDGGSLPIPENTQDENMGVWSEHTANESGYFTDALPTITLVSEELFDVGGLGLVFDIKNNVYPTIFWVSWYNGENLILSREYQSTSPSFSSMEDVENCNKITITFSKMNTPYSRLKLHAIQYGSVLIIEEKQIKNMRVHQTASTISTIIPVSSLELVFLNSTNANYNFMARQSLKVFDNNTLIGKYFIDTARQTNNQQWNIKAQDYINMLESAEFEGGIYVNELAMNIITAIFNKANVPFTISENLTNATVTGYIPYTTCRKALQQVLFAIGGYANTAYSESVDVLESDLPVTESIGLDRVLTGQTISVDADITEIELVGHTYTPIDSVVTLHQASEIEENLKVIFNQPAYDLTIENGEIVESGTNYAIITCNVGGILKGKTFEHLTFSKTKHNESTKNTKTINKKTIKNATLISSANIDNILNICYNYIVRNSTVKSKVIEAETPLIVGKAYEIETELLGKVTGILSEQNFSLYGGKKIVKETVIK
jgi:hypothetical protein